MLQHATRLIGYDCDGVLVPLRVQLPSQFVIISGRLYDEWVRTLAEIGHYGMPVYLRPYGQYGDIEMAGRWKAEMINALGITDFYEDNTQQANIITASCSQCTVHIVS